jgi:hypothetical protein
MLFVCLRVYVTLPATTPGILRMRTIARSRSPLYVGEGPRLS